jgi:hypothetical protein
VTDLVSRLLAAITETEEIAIGAAEWFGESATPGSAPSWRYVEVGHIWNDRDGDIADDVMGRHADHIALHDPASVLRRCEADREISELHRKADPPEIWLCVVCGPMGQTIDCTYPCDTVRLLARGYGLTEEDTDA